MNLTSLHPRRSRPLFAGWLLGTAVLTAALAGCTAPPDLDRDAARQLQSLVLSVTEAAAADDPATSLKHLDELKLQLDEAAARGEVSFKRHQSIQKSVDAVRADLSARQAEAEAARVAAEQERAAQEAAAQAAAAAAAAAAQAEAAAAAAAAAPPPAVAPAPPADSGRAKGKGKGKDD
ncbi:mucin-associated surface protein [Pseudarthrobacter sp. 1C304]|uniref:mucin-associated surface protein n=1 Tax=Pseudarthrobacter sp. 1C304 TaxID=3457438 RepID=UPI003FD52213